MAKENFLSYFPMIHNDIDEFTAYLEYTAGVLGFPQVLIEKDYYASLFLAGLYENKGFEPIFKGGTSISKIHTGFYRLSEDLDFTLSISPQASRSERSKKIKPIKDIIAKTIKKLPVFGVANPLSGSNESRQYIMKLEYPSITTNKKDFIKFEVGLRENLVESPIKGKAKTALINPFKLAPAIPEIEVLSLSKLETYAEKIRAALTRKDVAIRDYYDLYYAIKNDILVINDKLLEIVSKKLLVSGTPDVKQAEKRTEILKTQLNTELKPVLRDQDFANFNLDEAIRIVEELSLKIVLDKAK